MTVLSLLGHGVRAQCLEAVAYRSREDGFVDLREVCIALSETEVFVIGMAARESEIRAERGKRKHTLHAASRVLDRGARSASQAHEAIQDCRLVETGVAGFTHSLTLPRRGIRVQMNLVRSDQASHGWVFDQLEQEMKTLQHRFGGKLECQRMRGHRAS